MGKKCYILDYTFIFLSRAIRSFFLGVIALSLIENLLVKGLSIADITQVQIFIMIGYVLTSKLIIKQVKTLGVVNTLMIASLCSCATGFAIAHAKTANALSTAAFIGVFAIYGQWFCPFVAIERLALAQLAKDPTKSQEQYMGKVSKLIGLHKMLGYLFQGAGAIAAARVYNYGFHVLFFSLKDIGEKMLTFYPFSAFACMLIYAMLDRQKIESNVNDIDIQAHNEGSFGLLLSLIFCLQAVSACLFSQSYLVFILRFRHTQYYFDISTVFVNLTQCSIIGFFIYTLLRLRINGVVLYFFTSIVPNILILLFGIFYRDIIPIRIFLYLNFLLGTAASSDRPKLIHNLFPGSQRVFVNWLVMGGYLIGGVIGLKLQQRYFDNYGAPAFLAGVIRLVIDAIIITCYIRRRKEIGEFNNLMRGGPIASLSSTKVISSEVI